MNVMHGIAVKLTAICCWGLTARGEAATITFAVVKMMIDVSVKAIRPVIPGAGANEDAPGEPLRSIVPVRRAVVGRSFVISIRANWRYANIDRYLCIRFVRRSKEKPCSNRQETKRLYCFHHFPFQGWADHLSHTPQGCTCHSKPGCCSAGAESSTLLRCSVTMETGCPSRFCSQRAPRRVPP